MTKIHTPDGVEMTIHVFAKSDKTGMDTEIKFGELRFIEEFTGDRDPMSFLRSFLPNMTDDWRLMTVDEIAAYKREQGLPDDGSADAS